MLKIAPNLSLPDELAGEAIALIGIRGSGKTNTAGVISEELLDRNHPVAIIDPTDSWYGLRSSADGKRAGYPVIVFGGPHGDVPLEESSGKVVAEFVVAEHVPAILSLRHLRKNAQRRFVLEFSEELYHLKGRPANRSPLTVVIDEAPLFCPQSRFSDMAPLVGAIEDLIARGRNAGFGVVLISQRFATVAKNVTTQCGTIIAHRLPSPQDRKALKEWIEENASIEQQQQVLSSLPSLANGEAWIWSPRLDIFKRTQVRLRRTFDSSATPAMGKKAIAPRTLAEVDLAALQTRMAATIEKRRRIAELEKRLAGQKPVFDQAATEKAIAMAVEARDRHWQTEIAKAVKAVAAMHDRLDKIAKLAHVNGEASIAIAAPPSVRIPEIPAQHRTQIAKSPSVAAPTRVREAATGDAASHTLGSGERKILTACAQYADGASRETLTVLTGYKRSSRDTYIQRLRMAGYVEQRGDMVEATASGVSALGRDFERLPTGAALRDYWLARLAEGERIILQAVINEYPMAVSRDELSDATEYKRSSRDTYLQRLKSRRLVEFAGRGEVRAADVLFEE